MSKCVCRAVLDALPKLVPLIRIASLIALTNARFSFYPYLRGVYSVHLIWQEQNVVKRKCRQIAGLQRSQPRKSTHAIRVIISATMPKLPAKMASRWTRALEYALANGIPNSRLISFLKKNGGPSRCARLAARHQAEKVRYFDDWK